ncbi:MAG: Fic family protein [Verrucomicrobiales bacterium]|nr:Fic family protein [Verrucomicrobiales bacterium]
MKSLSPLPLPEFDQLTSSPTIWKALLPAHRNLAELKGLCIALPNPEILLETLAIQEAKDSSEIENIITTHDELYASQVDPAVAIAAKEVQHYLAALKTGFAQVKQSGIIRLETLLSVQSEVEQNNAGLRKLPGTVLKNEASGQIIYEPPQNAEEVAQLMANLVDFIHGDDGLDPLVRMAIAHHQFESIHPFYDGNGRTGRILNILILVRKGLLDIPILYLSRYINQTKQDYYRLLQIAREENRWEEWCVYILNGVSRTARSEIELIKQLRDLMNDYKQRIRDEHPKLYSQDLLNNLFRYPYTKINFLEKELGISRPTATKYLATLTEAGFLEKKKIGRSHFYINRALFILLTTIRLPDS